LSILATDHLVNKEITAGLLQTDNAESKAMSDKHGEESMESFLMFRIGQEHYGLPIEAVQQVTMLPLP
jgi:purine-binding chemotaxis protein CheW